jgi:anthranilate phosphoribosyltransferase
MPGVLRRVISADALTADEAQDVFAAIMSGHVTEAQIAALLTALAMRPTGPSAAEIIGAARAMRAVARPVPVPAGLSVIDTCGTGGDHSGSFNISTAAALVAAGAGAVIAKHGNRSVTSRSGSSQVLEELGVHLAVTDETLTRCLVEARICFCFAPAHHPAMKHVVPVRQQLGFRTIFNMLGPLTNPASATRQVLGVWSEPMTDLIASVLLQLGSVHAMVVHGSGLDEITTTGPTRIATVHRGSITTTTFTPQSLGIAPATADDLKAADVADSARIIRSVLGGERGPARDIVCINAAAALVVADVATDLSQGLTMAQRAIDSGAAKATLDRLIDITRGR